MNLFHIIVLRQREQWDCTMQACCEDRTPSLRAAFPDANSRAHSGTRETLA